MRKSCVLVCAAAVAAVVLSGCSSFHILRGERKVEAQYDPDGKDILVIPFRDLVFDHFEKLDNTVTIGSPEGALIAELAGAYIANHKITPVRYGRMVSPMVATLYLQHKDNPEEAWRYISNALEADLILIGEITKLETGDPSQVGMATGVLEYSACLMDMTGEDPGGIVWWVDRKQLTYPEGRAWDHGASPMDLPPERLKRFLLLRAGEEIGKAFHDHTEPIVKVGTTE